VENHDRGLEDTEEAQALDSDEGKERFPWLSVARNLILVGAIGSAVVPAIIGIIVLLTLLVFIVAVGVLLVVAFVLAIVVVFVGTIVLFVVVLIAGCCFVVLSAAAGVVSLPLVTTYCVWSSAPLWVWLMAEIVWASLLISIIHYVVHED
jgi:hypothetical protein